MATVKRILCLANSRKLNGRCVAGRELSAGRAIGWIRPVSSREHEEVSEYERQYEDGSDPRVLDIMDVPLLAPRPKGFQHENWLLDPDQYWSKIGRATWADLKRFIDPVSSLWHNNFSTYNGLNDRIPLEMTDAIDSSLRLLHIDGMTLSVFKPGEAFGNPKRRVQGQFVHDGTEYRLWVTDPRFEKAYLAKPDGDYKIGESFLTVSLGEPHGGACYKLIAAIILPGGGTEA